MPFVGAGVLFKRRDIYTPTSIPLNQKWSDALFSAAEEGTCSDRSSWSGINESWEGIHWRDPQSWETFHPAERKANLLQSKRRRGLKDIQMIVKTAWFEGKSLWGVHYQKMHWICCADVDDGVLQTHFDNQGVWNILQDLLGTGDCPCLPAAKWYFWTEGRLPRG